MILCPESRFLRAGVESVVLNFLTLESESEFQNSNSFASLLKHLKFEHCWIQSRTLSVVTSLYNNNYTPCLNKNWATIHSFVSLPSVDWFSNFFSLLYLLWNLEQNSCHMSRHTLKVVLLHYLAKHKRQKEAKFCCTFRNNSCLMFTELTNVRYKIKYALYGVKWYAQNFLLSHECPHGDVCATYHLRHWWHRWGEMQQQVYQVHNIHELKQRLIDVWHVFEQSVISLWKYEICAFNSTSYNAYFILPIIFVNSVNIQQELLRYMQQNFCHFRSFVFCSVVE